MSESRVKKSFLNARINLIFYVLVLAVTFFSRRMFLEKLGDDFIGLTSTLTNLLGLLNLAELGVGGAVAYMLYKPLVQGDRSEVNGIMSVFGFVYNRIGWIIAISALVLAAFLPLIFRDTPFNLSLIYFAYFSCMISVLLSYFINYRQLLLNADQRQYVVTGYYQGANILRLLVQMMVLYKTNNPYYWVAIEITFSLIYSFILNKRINKAFPWLKSEVKKGKALFREYPQLIKYTKQIFVHRIGATTLFNLSPVFIYAYTSLTMVAFYTNYQLIFGKMQQLVVQLVGSADAGVGQLVAEDNKERTASVFRELQALKYYVAGCVVIIMWFTIDPFIDNWIGKGYLLSNMTLAIMLVNLFIMLSRSAVDPFLVGHGLFYDVWAPLTEAAINIGVSIVGGIYWGLNGVLLGSTVSMLIIVVIWKPYFLFSKGFGISVWRYWRITLRLYLLIGAAFSAVKVLLGHIRLADPTTGFINWIVYSVVTTVLCGLILYGLLYAFMPGMRQITARIYCILKSKFMKKH